MRSDLNIASEQTPGRSVSARSANRRSREPETRGVGPPSCIWPPSRQADSADHSRDPLRNDWVEPEPPTPLGTEAGVVERLPSFSPSGDGTPGDFRNRQPSPECLHDGGRYRKTHGDWRGEFGEAKCRGSNPLESEVTRYHQVRETH